MKTSRLAMTGILAGLIASGLAIPAIAETSNEEPTIGFSADEVNYDQELSVVTASGNVEVQYEDRVLVADTISYNQRQDVLTTSGNISLVEPTGEVIFADYMELSGDLKNGIIRDLRIILADKSRIAANSAERRDGNTAVFSKGVYSPCDLCKDDPERPPLWQVKAIKVIHDKERRSIEYNDAWLEFAGIPVLYTPYMSHPDPTVKRESGFLTPSFGNSSDLGMVFRTPYFWAIDENSDLTVTPMYTTSEGLVLSGEYRRKLMDGEVEAEASITQNSDDEWHGHIRSEGRFDIDRTWRWGYDLDRTSHDTYLRRYGFESESILTSKLYTEGFRKRNYFSAESYIFQDLRTDDDDEAPIALPLLDYNHVSEAGRSGAYTTWDANLMALTRGEGHNTQRMSSKLGWHLPYTGPMGDVYKLSATLQTDLYHVTDFVPDNQSNEYDGFAERFFPQIALDWRYPFTKDDGAVHQLVEPVAGLVIAPNGGNSNKIPNEDSVDFEFDDTNLMSTNRFTGLDRVEGGTRVNYGLKYGIFGKQGGSSTVFFGQSYRMHKDSTFVEGSGLEDHLSDYVARIRMKPNDDVSLTYRTRLDKDDLAARRNELNLSLQSDAATFSTTYAFFDQQEGSEYSDREEVTVSIGAELTKFWSTDFSIIRDLTDDGGTRSVGLSFTYEDECFAFTTDMRREYYEDREIEPTDSIMLRFSFKTLGDFETAAL